jgi:hypothetical protein
LIEQNVFQQKRTGKINYCWLRVILSAASFADEWFCAGYSIYSAVRHHVAASFLNLPRYQRYKNTKQHDLNDLFAIGGLMMSCTAITGLAAVDDLRQ